MKLSIDKNLTKVANERTYAIHWDSYDKTQDDVVGEVHIGGKEYYIKTYRSNGTVNGIPCKIDYDVIAYDNISNESAIILGSYVVWKVEE